MLKVRLLIASSVVLVILLAGCGAPTQAQSEPPTPTPLPREVDIERPTFIVKRETIERVLDVNGRVIPVDLVRLAFKRAGRVETIKAKRGDTIKTGNVLAELHQDDEQQALRDAEDGLTQAQRDLATAQQKQQMDVQASEQAFQQAQEDLQRVQPGGPDDPIPAAQQALEAAKRAAEETNYSGSENKTNAEQAVTKTVQGLQDAQQAYSVAFWNNDWAEKHDTDPAQPETIDPVTGKKRPNKLSDQQKADYKQALVKAERAMNDIQQGIELAQRALDKARADEIYNNDQATKAVQEAQHKLDDLVQGKGNKGLIDGQRTVDSAQLKLDQVKQANFDTQTKAIETAQRTLEKARKTVEEGRLIAPQDGVVLAVANGEGDNVEAFAPIIELADPSKLEVAAELNGDQMRQLAEGQLATISLLTRPDVIMPATIRLMPAPYGSGGSGAVEEQDRTTRFQMTDTKGQELTPGIVAKIRIVLEHKDHVLTLPPEAVRSFEDRRFVVVRSGDHERRAPVKVGIETDDRIEIVDGVKEGDVVVSP